MPTKIDAPSEVELKATLGKGFVLWSEIVRVVEEACTPIDPCWKPYKADFGRMCLLQHKKRTLLYITRDKATVWIAIVLGDRAYQLAMASSLPAAIKKKFSGARPYAEGRGIRFTVDSLKDIPTIAKLLEIKMTPK